jgi:predicted DCC family thiol-disulfide oxidoreductase YuxK
VLIFDGDCAFCTTTARWVETRLEPGHPVVAWQALESLEPFRLTVDDVTTAAWWIDVRGTPHRGERAMGHALLACRAPWPIVGRLLLVPPVCWLAAPIYRWVARNRHRMPGATDACALPPTEEQPARQR